MFIVEESCEDTVGCIINNNIAVFRYSELAASQDIGICNRYITCVLRVGRGCEEQTGRRA